jgi:hypothetical protein
MTAASLQKKMERIKHELNHHSVTGVRHVSFRIETIKVAT